MLELLIPSQARIKLLTLFLLNPGREYYIREIERITGEHYAAIHSELANLENFGLLSRNRRGKQVYFSVNTGFFLYHELQQIVLKTEGASRVLREQLPDLNGISCLFIYGSFAAGTADSQSDIDLFIVGDIGDDTILAAVVAAEKQLGREVNYTLMTDQEFRERQRKREAFVSNVMREPRIILVGCND
ncbi:MAG: nucleotidyltransferase domain-containing protein [Methanoregulaceae archaeon]|jgi:predicted nucleotidyltransferase